MILFSFLCCVASGVIVWLISSVVIAFMTALVLNAMGYVANESTNKAIATISMIISVFVTYIIFKCI